MVLNHEKENVASRQGKTNRPPGRSIVVVTFLAFLVALLAVQILGFRDSDWPNNYWRPPKNDNYYFSTHLKNLARKKKKRLWLRSGGEFRHSGELDRLSMSGKNYHQNSFIMTIFPILRVLCHLATEPFRRHLLCRFVTFRPAVQFIALGDHDPS